MATIQISKNRATETLNRTAITQKQSIDVVQTMLHGGLSCITYLRSLFTERAYDNVVYDASAAIQPYEDYACGKPVARRTDSEGRRTTLEVLRRGRSKRVDRLLDWLEHGAFPALQAGNLRALEIYIHADRTSREKVMETYRFNIRYHSQMDESKMLAGIDLNGAAGSFISIGATNTAFGDLLRRIMSSSQNLPLLPPERYMSMALFYVNDTAITDQPNGFEPNSDVELHFARANNWERKDEDFEALESGFHRTSICISHLHPVDPRTSMLTAGDLLQIPAELQYDTLFDSIPRSTASHILDQNALTAYALSQASTPSLPTIIDNDEGAVDTLVTGTPEAHGLHTSPAHPEVPLPGEPNDDNPDEPLAPELPSLPKASQRLLSQFDDIPNTQSSNVPEMRRALGAMMQAENFTQGDTQLRTSPPPQLAANPNAQSSGLSRSSKALLLSQSVVSRLQFTKTNHQYPHAVSDPKSSQRDEILCQCGCNRAEGDMVQCSYCKSWQHLHCYGFTGQNDQRLPEDHVCYQCLLGSDDEETFAKLKDLIPKRRAAHVALCQGLRTQKDLATAMRISTTNAKDLYNQMRGEGYVTAATGSKSAGYASTGKPYFVVPKEGPKHDQMITNLFDPLLHISHYYDLPSEQITQRTTLTQQLAASKAGDMPPPMTPASQLRRQKAAMTPASGLDLRDSMTPYKTPSRMRTEQPPSPKRPFKDDDEDTIAVTPRAYRSIAGPSKRIKSVRTDVMLDAAGLSSSPAHSIKGV